MAGAIVVASATFLVAVAGLLAPLPLPPHAPRRRALPARKAEGGKGYGSFDASAWENIASVSPASPASSSAPSSSSSARTGGSSSAGNAQTTRDDANERGGGGEQEIIDVDVGKLPTFVFFFGAGDDGKPWREDVVGGGNARACEAKLRKIMASVPPLEGAGAGEEQRRAGVVRGGRAANGDLDGVANSCAGSDRDGGDSGGTNSTPNKNTNNILEIRSKDDLLGVLATRKKGQGPVVVMYHAPWCRKCAYLTPVFRRLAAARTPAAGEGQAAGRGGGAGDSASAPSTADGPIFCRADVSHPSWGRSIVSGPTDAVSGGTAASTAVVAAGEGSSGVGGIAGGGDAATPTIYDGARAATVGDTENEFLHTGSPAMENCDVCMKTGFVPCGECEGKGAVARTSPDGKHMVAVTCSVCVGYKRLRCPSCGGKCYMCD